MTAFETGTNDELRIMFCFTMQNPSSGWADLKDSSEPGKSSSWNPEVFVKVVKEMVGTIYCL